VRNLRLRLPEVVCAARREEAAVLRRSAAVVARDGRSYFGCGRMERIWYVSPSIVK
jgi:hypothetical protein